MKKIFVACFLTAAFAISFFSCQQTTSINPTLVSPISGLILTVDNEDFTAVPLLNGPGVLSDTLVIKVDVPTQFASIKQLTFASNAIKSSIKSGDTLLFSNNMTSIAINNSGTPQTYIVKMVVPVVPIMYVVYTSNKSAFGTKYFLDKTNPQILASINDDGNFEGYVDLTATNWDNLSFVSGSLKEYFDGNTGLSYVSYGSLTLVTNQCLGNDSSFSSPAGPWALWTYTASNPAITSPGYWKVNFDTASLKLTLLETQWAVVGSATGNSVVPLSYNSATKQWSATTTLVTGTLNFTTIPVTSGDPVVSYGDKSATSPRNILVSPGNPIAIQAPGNYTITMDLHKAPYYSYSIK